MGRRIYFSVEEMLSDSDRERLPSYALLTEADASPGAAAARSVARAWGRGLRVLTVRLDSLDNLDSTDMDGSRAHYDVTLGQRSPYGGFDPTCGIRLHVDIN